MIKVNLRHPSNRLDETDKVRLRRNVATALARALYPDERIDEQLAYEFVRVDLESYEGRWLVPPLQGEIQLDETFPELPDSVSLPAVAKEACGALSGAFDDERPLVLMLVS